MLLERLNLGEVHTRPCEVLGKVILDLLRFWAPMRLAIDTHGGGWGVSRKPIITKGWGHKSSIMTPLSRWLGKLGMKQAGSLSLEQDSSFSRVVPSPPTEIMSSATVKPHENLRKPSPCGLILVAMATNFQKTKSSLSDTLVGFKAM